MTNILNEIYEPIFLKSVIKETIKRKLIGHYNYYGINNNSKSICDYYIYMLNGMHIEY